MYPARPNRRGRPSSRDWRPPGHVLGDAGRWAEPMARNRSSQRSRRGSSANRTRSVLSPASVPSCSCRVDSSMAWAMTLAVPGVPIRSRMSPLRPTRDRDVGEDPAQALVGRRRRVGAARSLRRRRRRGRRRAGTLTRPSSAMSRDDGRLGHLEALRAQRVGELALAADRCARDELADRPLAVALERPGPASGAWAAITRRPTRAARPAVIRVPNVGSSSARSSAFGARRVGDDRLGAVPGEGGRARPGSWAPCRRR